MITFFYPKTAGEDPTLFSTKKNIIYKHLYNNLLAHRSLEIKTWKQKLLKSRWENSFNADAELYVVVNKHIRTIGFRTILMLGWICLQRMRKSGASFCPAGLSGSMTASIWTPELIPFSLIALHGRLKQKEMSANCLKLKKNNIQQYWKLYVGSSGSFMLVQVKNSVVGTWGLNISIIKEISGQSVHWIPCQCPEKASKIEQNKQ